MRRRAFVVCISNILRKLRCYLKGRGNRRGGRVVEGARLESVYTPKGYRGFESRSLREISAVNRLLRTQISASL